MFINSITSVFLINAPMGSCDAKPLLHMDDGIKSMSRFFALFLLLFDLVFACLCWRADVS